VSSDAGTQLAKARQLEQDLDWYAAARELDAARALQPSPDLLFEAAHAYELSGERDEALKRFSEYLGVAPKGVHAEEARQARVTIKKGFEPGDGTWPLVIRHTPLTDGSVGEAVKVAATVVGRALQVSLRFREANRAGPFESKVMTAAAGGAYE